MATLKGASKPLTDEVLQILVHGPWCVGKTLLTMPDDDILRALWQAHEATIRAAAVQAGVDEPWIVGRMWFVDLIDGKLPRP